MNSGRQDCNGTFATPRNAAYYGYEDDDLRSKMPLVSEELESTDLPITFHEPALPTEDCPMPADRQARKQRTFGRRGGACHSVLLKSAVIASMSSSLDDGDEEEILTNRTAMSAQERTPDKHTSPRKRARHLEKEESEDHAIAKASEMLGTLSVFLNQEEEDEELPHRRVSRKTSHDSCVSDGAESLEC